MGSGLYRLCLADTNNPIDDFAVPLPGSPLCSEDWDVRLVKKATFLIVQSHLRRYDLRQGR